MHQPAHSPATLDYIKFEGPPDDWREYAVFCDDVPMQYVLEADVKQGWVKKLQIGKNGKPQMDVLGEVILTETRHGRVEILRPQ